MAKILVVDDAQFMRVRLTKLLVGQGYEVLEAENGGAMQFSERISSQEAFQKMLTETSCLSILKTLARMALWGEKND